MSEDIEVHEEVTPVEMPPASLTSEDGAIATTDMLSAASNYEARGFSVIPLVTGEKRPAVKVAPYLHGSRRMTEADIRTHWTANPHHGVGIVTGAPSGLVVVDCDPRNGGDNDQTLRDCPSDLVAQTGGGGLHIFCRYAGGQVPCGKTSRPGVDLKADGGLVVAAPSLHPSGKRYEWLRFGEPGELPPWAIEKPQATPGGDGGEERERWIAETIANPAAVLPGTQEETVTRLTWYYAGQVQQGRVDYDIALSTLCLWTSQLPLGNEHHPWTEQHVQDRLDRALEKRKNEFPITVVGATRVDRPSGGSSGKRELTDDEAIALVVAACRSAKVRSLEQPPHVEWIAPLVLPRGVLVDLHGDPKAGKSTLLAHLLRAVLDGGEFFGHPTAKTKGVWFTEQPPPTFAPLLQDAGLYEHPNLIVLHHHEVMAASWRQRVSALVQVAKAEGAGVLVIDTFTKLAGIRGEDENQSGSVLTALDALEMAKAAGLTVILVRHDRKSGGGAVDAGRGSNAVAGEADVIYQLVKDTRDAPNVRRLRYVGRLGEIPAERVMSLVEDGYRLADTSGERSAEQLRAAQRADWELIASVAPRTRDERVSGTALVQRLAGRLASNKVMERLAEYRQAVEEPDEEGWDRDPGLLVWRGKDGRSGYWRACACRMEVVPCGQCEGCRGENPCEAPFKLRLVTDPECSEGHQYSGASTS